MGDRYEMPLECPNCGKLIWCYYADEQSFWIPWRVVSLNGC